MEKEHEHITDREAWYDRQAESIPQDPATKIKISAKQKGELNQGYRKLSTPTTTKPGHLQTESTRDKVGAKAKFLRK